MSLITLQPGNTVQFTWVSSIAPDAAPRFNVRDKGNTVVHSATAAQSNTFDFYALYTIPDGDAWYSAEWLAQKTIGGSAYNFINRLGFRVLETIAET